MQIITEEMKVHEEWYTAKPKTPEELAAFVTKLITEYRHDYGTICHAAAAAAVAAARVVDASPQGGITGFQAGAIMSEFMKHWLHVKGPWSLVRFENMLYPQYARDFQSPALHPRLWKWVQDEANKLLDDHLKNFIEYQREGKIAAHADPYADASLSGTSPEVVKHWKNIVGGRVPFGCTVLSDVADSSREE